MDGLGGIDGSDSENARVCTYVNCPVDPLGV